jgi:hypothetical protein
MTATAALPLFEAFLEDDLFAEDAAFLGAAFLGADLFALADLALDW